jgi:hypothetical protein
MLPYTAALDPPLFVRTEYGVDIPCPPQREIVCRKPPLWLRERPRQVTCLSIGIQGKHVGIKVLYDKILIISLSARRFVNPNDESHILILLGPASAAAARISCSELLPLRPIPFPSPRNHPREEQAASGTAFWWLSKLRERTMHFQTGTPA